MRNSDGLKRSKTAREGLTSDETKTSAGRIEIFFISENDDVISKP